MSSQHSKSHPVVYVLGAGAIGLEIALGAVELGCHVVVRHDATNYGASYIAAGLIEKVLSNEKGPEAMFTKALAAKGYDLWHRMAAEHPKFAIVRESHTFSRSTGLEVPLWAAELPNSGARPLRERELPPGFASGWSYQTAIVDTHRYMEHMLHDLADQGVVFWNKRVNSSDDVLETAAGAPPPDLVIDAMSAGSAKIFGGEYQAVHGQLLVYDGIPEGTIKHSRIYWGDGDSSQMAYVFPLPNERVIVGGTAEPRYNTSGSRHWQLPYSMGKTSRQLREMRARAEMLAAQLREHEPRWWRGGDRPVGMPTRIGELTEIDHTPVLGYTGFGAWGITGAPAIRQHAAGKIADVLNLDAPKMRRVQPTVSA